MALSAFYFIITLTKALTYYYTKRSQRHLLAAIENNWLESPDNISDINLELWLMYLILFARFQSLDLYIFLEIWFVWSWTTGNIWFTQGNPHRKKKALKGTYMYKKTYSTPDETQTLLSLHAAIAFLLYLHNTHVSARPPKARGIRLGRQLYLKGGKLDIEWVNDDLLWSLINNMKFKQNWIRSFGKNCSLWKKIECWMRRA